MTGKLTTDVVLEGGETVIPAGTQVTIVNKLDDGVYIVRTSKNTHALLIAVTPDEIEIQK